jgi:hypothetical protein
LVETISHPPTALVRRYEKTDALIQKNRLPVRFFGYAPLFSGSLVYPGPKSDWAIMNLPDDPFYSQHNGRLYAPRAVVTDVKKFHDAGLNFDGVFIAHEIPKGSVRRGEDVPFELIAPPPTTLSAGFLALLFIGIVVVTLAIWVVMIAMAIAMIAFVLMVLAAMAGN